MTGVPSSVTPEKTPPLLFIDERLSILPFISLDILLATDNKVTMLSRLEFCFKISSCIENLELEGAGGTPGAVGVATDGTDDDNFGVAEAASP